MLLLSSSFAFAQAVQKEPETQQKPEVPKASVPQKELENAGNEDVARVMRTFQGRGELTDGSDPTPAAAAMKAFKLDEGLKIELVATEPDVMQPLFMSFDERGRMWVVQYKQYPFPAGLKVIRYDQHLRAVFDQVPKAPPEHTRGADEITVWEDLDGDGKYETHRTVIDGLNIATSVVSDSHGIWVLNPPYLLFYPDTNGDAVPDGEPTVHLSGFGMEDTHSVANSLCWGPDGWLYAANGSTTTGNVLDQTGKTTPFQGQCIWRYHPKRGVFEIYAEGGGNTFSTEIDAKGRVFSGTNHGNTRGMYYPQGSYGEKNWGKHGPLTNPYAFGYFKHMRFKGDGDRFPQAFAIYEGYTLPKKYHGNIIAANALHNRVWLSDRIPDTSSFRTEDNVMIAETEDRWFRPVDVKVGPDGGIYLADWYDSRLSHVDPRDTWHKTTGRIYRIVATDPQPIPEAFKRLFPSATHFDLTKLSTADLLVVLGHPNKLMRTSAVRVLGQRQDQASVAPLRQIVLSSQDERTLEALWALNWQGAFDEALRLECLSHTNPVVREWTVRLIGDDDHASATLAEKLQRMAQSETDLHVRTQLACTAKRLPPNVSLPMFAALVAHDEDVEDLHQPLLCWWALEAQCERDREAVLKMFENGALWRIPMVKANMLDRLMQRFAMTGTEADWQTCARLMQLAPSLEEQRSLVRGLREALAGRTFGKLPEALETELTKYRTLAKESDLPLRLRSKEEAAIAQAIKLLGDAKADKAEKLEIAEILGETRAASAISVLLKLLNDTSSHSLQRVALQALAHFENKEIGTTICRLLHSSLPTEHDVQHSAFRVLASRPEWSGQLLNEVDEYRLSPQQIPMDIVEQMRLHQDEQLQARIKKLWGQTRSTPVELRAEVERVRAIIKKSQGDLGRGEVLFKQKCGVCHTLFGSGGKTGPDLTGYERTNLEFLLPSVIDPSAAIREEFTNYQIVTDDGRVLTGLIDKQDTQTITLRGVDNQTTLVSRDQIEVLQALSRSLMPEGLLKDMDHQQLQDLFAYLTARTQR